jgi:hypothetical protein
MKPRERDYIYYSETTSLCPRCLNAIPAKIIIKNKSVHILKNCRKHGEQLELLEEDAEYYLKRGEYDKPGTLSKTQTKINKGCPFDCGLCPEHEQHTCIALLEITNDCDLKCPMCYAEAGKKNTLSLGKISKMLDMYQDSEFGKAELLQISGGEPTTHPDIIEIIKLARAKKFKYVMLNTNGLRISEDIDFVKELSQFKGGFEIYLQFDGFDKKAYFHLRGRDLTEIKRKAIKNLAEHEIPITLVSTIEKGVNDKEIGNIVKFGIETKYIRGVNFQPIAFFGRLNKVNLKDRITLTGILNRLEQQTNGMIKKGDFIPLPCNVERVAITFLYRSDGEFIPITRNAKIKKYLPFVKNTFTFMAEDVLRESAKGLLKGNFCDCLDFLKDFMPVVPAKFYLKSKKGKMDYVTENTFRISVTSFIDAYNFDAKSMKKECVHILTPDFRKIPFSSYNILHRQNAKHNPTA